MNGKAIQALMSSGWFSFRGAEGLAEGSSIWLSDTGRAGGYVRWNQKLSATWSLPWEVQGDQSCLQTAPDMWMCSQIYGYRNGFLEVYSDGTIHTVTLPGSWHLPFGLMVPPNTEERAPLLTAEEAGENYVALMVWAQGVDLELLEERETQNKIQLKLRDSNGGLQEVEIDPTSGWIKSPKMLSGLLANPLPSAD